MIWRITSVSITSTCLLIAAGAFQASSAQVPALAAAARPRSSLPDITVLFSRAVKHVRSKRTFDKAIVYEADGTTRKGGTTSASGIVRWQFVFDNYASHSRFASATISYGPPPKRFGPLQGNTQPFLEDVQITKAPQMTLAEAVKLLHKAGYGARFFTVTLRDPLGPRPTGPLYIFGFRHRYVAVNIHTKKVSVEH